LSDEEVLELTDIALKIERHYSDRAGLNQPMDIEWARDGIDGKLYVVQARPETVTGRNAPGVIEHYQFDQPSDSRAKPVLSGRAVGHQIASGKVRVIRSSEDIIHFQPGEILVATTTSPDWGNVMQQASAIITDHGGRTCHAAIVAREMGIPAVVGTTNATEILDYHDVVTVACHSGQTGNVYRGDLAFSKLQTNIDVDHRPRTKILLNIGNPDIAFKSALLPNDGVGLARMEFIISNHVKVHPMAARFPQRILPTEQHQLTSLAEGYTSAQEYFVTKLAEGIATIAGAFYPKPVIVRLSDFKSNEYAQLLGGKSFEPNESNPMIGFRGASRYSHPNYREGFALECEAIRRVRETMGFNNTQVMVPFCRRVVEGQRTLEEMRKHGLVRGANLKIYLMCEIPNNVILIDDFAQDFDGFSIGSNDLTQLTLGVDRDSEIVAFDFDERDPGVLAMMRMAVEGAHRNGRTCGICGQAPSDYPEVAEYLVKLGIDSMSLNPDTVLSTTQRVIDVEKRLNRVENAG
jgi:pyruvate,water dikinase